MTEIAMYQSKIAEARMQLHGTTSQRRAHDLRKHIFRMERELRHYLNYQKEAGEKTCREGQTPTALRT